MEVSDGAQGCSSAPQTNPSSLLLVLLCEHSWGSLTPLPPSGSQLLAQGCSTCWGGQGRLGRSSAGLGE